MKIYLEEEQVLEDNLLEKMEQVSDILLKSEDIDSDRAEISLTLVTPSQIKDLNRDYREVDKITDVLSFPQFDDMNDLPEQGELCLGDVVICIDKVKEQAEEYGHSYERELLYLFVHSLLHLVGYDHMEEEQKKDMRKREEEIMSQMDLRR